MAAAASAVSSEPATQSTNKDIRMCKCGCMKEVFAAAKVFIACQSAISIAHNEVESIKLQIQQKEMKIAELAMKNAELEKKIKELQAVVNLHQGHHESTG